MPRKYDILSFSARIREKATLAEIAERVGKALGCHFAEGWASHFREGEEVLVAETLGMLMEISAGLRHDEPKEKISTYFLMGWTHDRLEAKWPIEQTVINITPYILQILHTLDSPHWDAR